jgi:hypothetical protein
MSRDHLTVEPAAEAQPPPVTISIRDDATQHEAAARENPLLSVRPTYQASAASAERSEVLVRCKPKLARLSARTEPVAHGIQYLRVDAFFGKTLEGAEDGINTEDLAQVERKLFDGMVPSRQDLTKYHVNRMCARGLQPQEKLTGILLRGICVRRRVDEHAKQRGEPLLRRQLTNDPNEMLKFLRVDARPQFGSTPNARFDVGCVGQQLAPALANVPAFSCGR